MSGTSKRRLEKFIFVFAVTGFLIHLLIIALVQLGYLVVAKDTIGLQSPIDALYTPFSIILFYEVYCLIYYFPKSMTIYIGKQFEIITLITIRDMFDEISNLSLSSDLQMNRNPLFIYSMVTILILFFLIFVFYKQNQKAIRINNNTEGMLIRLPKKKLKYLFAKQVIQMIYKLSKEIENDPLVRDKLKVFFLQDYRVTMAELMIPSADISEQISLASTEASGTGNMKLMMNGAVTLGTEDGANVEIHSAVGDDNIIIFGMQTPEVLALQKQGYSPYEYYNNNAELREALDFIGAGFGGQSFGDIYYSLKNHDNYMALADFADYRKAQQTATKLYNESDVWNKMSLTNIAKSGIFAADRSIADYARDIWKVKPVK